MTHLKINTAVKDFLYINYPNSPFFLLFLYRITHTKQAV